MSEWKLFNNGFNLHALEMCRGRTMILMSTGKETQTPFRSNTPFSSNLPPIAAPTRTEGQCFGIDAGFAQVDEDGEGLSVQARVEKVGDLVHGWLWGGRGTRREGSEGGEKMRCRTGGKCALV